VSHCGSSTKFPFNKGKVAQVRALAFPLNGRASYGMSENDKSFIGALVSPFPYVQLRIFSKQMSRTILGILTEVILNY
jgi:hypothetical protein